MTQHDTPEAVEEMAARCDNAHRIMLSGAFYAEAAAMLRRLHARAVKAEARASAALEWDEYHRSAGAGRPANAR